MAIQSGDERLLVVEIPDANAIPETVQQAIVDAAHVLAGALAELAQTQTGLVEEAIDQLTA